MGESALIVAESEPIFRRPEWRRRARPRKESPDAELEGEHHRDHRRSLRGDQLEVMLIYSMSVSVDGFIADRKGAFAWAAPGYSAAASSCIAASKARLDAGKSVRRTNARASWAPYSRSIPESSHSIESGP